MRFRGLDQEIRGKDQGIRGLDQRFRRVGRRTGAWNGVSRAGMLRGLADLALAWADPRIRSGDLGPG